MSKVKVRLLVNTAYQGPKREGEEVLVPEDFAARWVKNKIAVYVEQEVVEEEISEDSVPVEDEADEVVEKPANDFESMSAKELYALCKEKGLDVEAKKNKAYYVEKLS